MGVTFEAEHDALSVLGRAGVGVVCGPYRYVAIKVAYGCTVGDIRQMRQIFVFSRDIPCGTGATITDVSNQVENNGGMSSGQVPKQRTSAGGKEDAENSSIGSPLQTFEDFDS